MTQGENVNPCPLKKTQREGKFPIQEREKTQKEKKKREFPIQEREETQNRNKVPDQRSEESKRRKFSIKGRKKTKRKEENSRSKIGRKQRKKKIPDQRQWKNYTEGSLDQTISEQYEIVASK